MRRAVAALVEVSVVPGPCLLGRATHITVEEARTHPATDPGEETV